MNKKPSSRFGISDADVAISKNESRNYTIEMAKFSRRVGKIMHQKPISNMSAKERIKFTSAVDKAGVYENLSDEYKSVIISAENIS